MCEICIKGIEYCGLGNVHSPLELDEEEWESTMKTNLTGTWLVSKHMCIRMRDAKHGGSIINISSIAGLDRGQLPGALAYACSKTGVNTLTKVIFNVFITGLVMLSAIVYKNNYKLYKFGM